MENERLLTDEEMGKILDRWEEATDSETEDDLNRQIAKAQDLKSFEAGRKQGAREVMKAMELHVGMDINNDSQIKIWYVDGFGEPHQTEWYKSLKTKFGIKE